MLKFTAFFVLFLLWPFAGLAWAQATPMVAIEGLDNPRLANNVRQSLPPLRLDCDAPAIRWLSYVRHAEQRAQSALRALGHFNPHITTDINFDQPCPTVKLTIEPGPAVLVEVVVIRIIGPFEHEGLAFLERQANRLRVGQTLDQGLYDSTRDALITHARAKGFLDAQYLEQTLWVDAEFNIARVTLVLQSGERYRFGEVQIEPSALAPAFVQRLMQLKEGETYSSDALARMSSNLMRSGYFSQARVTPNLDGVQDLSVPIDVALTMRARTAYTLRMGFGTDTGLGLRGDVDRRYVNTKGHRWRAGVGYSQRVQTIHTVYAMPLNNPLTDSLDVYGRLQREDINQLSTTHHTAGVQWSWQSGPWNRALFTEVLGEQSRFGQKRQNARQFWLGGGRLGYRLTDDPMFPSQGYSWDLELKGASTSLLSSASLAQARFNVAWAHPVGQGIVKARGETATTWTNDFDKLPKSLRWFAGGDQSVRGYAFESLGPRDNNGNVVGGQHRLLLSLEGLYPVVGNDWYAAAFVDAGNAFNRFGQIDLHTGAGLGARWRSPIGLVRIDVAQPLKGSVRQPRLHLAVGAEF